ncbi:MAG: PAS domain S-box protein, partial [Planctomycetota bacterium]
QEHHTEYLDRYLRTGQARLVGKTVELTGKRREGTMFPLEATVSEVRLPGRRLFTGIFRDITERKRADEALRLDEARLEALVKLNDMAEAPFRQVADFALEEAVRVTTSKMGFLGFMSDDESVMTIHAWSTGAMQECAIGEKPKVFAIADAGLWGEVIRQRQPIVVNDYLGMKIWKQGFPEGHAQIWRFLGVPLFDGKRIVAVAAVANKQDDYEDADIRQLTLLITGVWRVLQRQRAREALRTSEEREFASDCIYWRSPDGDVLYVSPGCAELTGYTPEEFCASPRLFDTVVHPEDRALWEQHEHAALADDSPQTLEFRIVTKTGELRWVSHVCRPIHDAAGRFLGVRGSNRDITERRRLEEEILEISRREEQRIGQDLHDVVGQRLTGIAFLIKALQRRLAEQTLPEASAAAEIASMASETIIETRTLAKGLCPVDLTADGLMTALQEHAANVEELYDIVCTFKCDRPVLVHEGAVATHLYRIAQEAVNNATKHAQAQRIEITIAADDERRVTLTVRDDGVGLPDDFDRTDGMGLRIMNYRARMIGATLDVSRNRGGGTRASQLGCLKKSLLQRAARVLLVDDHPIVRQGLAELIEQEPDLSVCGQAETAPEGLEAAVALQPDLAIVDVALGDTSGLQLIKDVRTRLPDLLVLVLSMKDEALYAERVLRAGARGYVMKEVATETLMTAIRKVLTGQVYLSPRMETRLLSKLAAAPAATSGSSIEHLSDRELEVFELIGLGLSTREIA